MDVHGHNIVHVNHRRALHLAVLEQAVQLKEVGRRHQFQNVRMVHLQRLAAAVVQILHNKLKKKRHLYQHRNLFSITT